MRVCACTRQDSKQPSFLYPFIHPHLPYVLDPPPPVSQFWIGIKMKSAGGSSLIQLYTYLFRFVSSTFVRLGFDDAANVKSPFYAGN